ncbi:MAG: 8-oxoguanine glycosylase ogg1 [Bogoriella megaspora]|nr:MAG: 8-oxoguanine glycosylase ogg1 [Bogoriella megaspora]
MAPLADRQWHKLPISLTELCIDTTLRCGQSFRWRKSGPDEWSMALHGRILSLRQDKSHLHYRAIFPSNSKSTAYAPLTPPSSAASSPSKYPQSDDTLSLLQHYLNLSPNLSELYKQWSTSDPHFRKTAPKFTGVRILKQDPWEALVGFICSSNNNIARISQMVDKLCREYGTLIGHLDHKGEEGEVQTVPYYDFPTASSLTGKNVEGRLRELGFGYRAKYLYQTACIVTQEHEDGWLAGLRNPESIGKQGAGELVEGGREGYRNAHEALLELQGVGPKVADCVCLMGLGWGEAVPVDTHVWQIAQRDYKFGKGKHSSLTKATYDAVANKFRSLWGKEAGWAHSVLFTADLKAFSERLVAKLESKEEIDVIKMKTDGTVESVGVTKSEIITDKRIKREFEEDEHKVVEIEQIVVKKPKRRRRV